MTDLRCKCLMGSSFSSLQPGRVVTLVEDHDVSKSSLLPAVNRLGKLESLNYVAIIIVCLQCQQSSSPRVLMFSTEINPHFCLTVPLTSGSVDVHSVFSVYSEITPVLADSLFRSTYLGQELNKHYFFPSQMLNVSTSLTFSLPFRPARGEWPMRSLALRWRIRSST